MYMCNTKYNLFPGSMRKKNPRHSFGIWRASDPFHGLLGEKTQDPFKHT